jgi:DNA uptake protein ComE-like DNA-binding protein
VKLRGPGAENSHPAVAGLPSIPTKRRGEGGFILLGILILVMLISMVAVSLMFRVRADETASAASAGGDQAFAAAMAGVQEAQRVVKEMKPGYTDWEDDPRAFKERLVYDDGSDKWYFTIWSPGSKDSLQEVRYGLTDEARKINVNAATKLDLTKLPNVTPQMAGALLDFVDFDDLTRPEGAEQDYYNTLPQPYTIRNGPIPTLDGLLLVRGFTPAVLYGDDVNMNWRVDANEGDALTGGGVGGIGLRPFLTVYASEPNQDHDGVPRTNINDPLDPFPGVEFPAGVTNFVTAMRNAHLAFATAADLLEAKITVKDEKGKDQTIESGVGKEELPLVLDLFTGTSEKRQDGLINVNTAPGEVLATVPEIDEPLAETIQSTRRSISPEHRATIAWLYQEGVVDAAKFKRIAPYLSARSFQFSFQVIGFGVPSGRFRRMEVVIDSSESGSRVVYLRDLTRLGLPFKLEPQTTEAPAQARALVKPEKINRG